VDGSAVGNAFGFADTGDVVGAFVFMVGANEGTLVGFKVGLVDGKFVDGREVDGLNVGKILGNLEGSLVVGFAKVGEVVGSTDGFLEGLTVGLFEGVRDGATEGRYVGRREVGKFDG